MKVSKFFLATLLMTTSLSYGVEMPIFVDTSNIPKAMVNIVTFDKDGNEKLTTFPRVSGGRIKLMGEVNKIIVDGSILDESVSKYPGTRYASLKYTNGKWQKLFGGPNNPEERGETIYSTDKPWMATGGGFPVYVKTEANASVPTFDVSFSGDPKQSIKITYKGDLDHSYHFLGTVTPSSNLVGVKYTYKSNYAFREGDDVPSFLLTTLSPGEKPEGIWVMVSHFPDELRISKTKPEDFKLAPSSK